MDTMAPHSFQAPKLAQWHQQHQKNTINSQQHHQSTASGYNVSHQHHLPTSSDNMRQSLCSSPRGCRILRRHDAGGLQRDVALSPCTSRANTAPATKGTTFQ